MMQEIDLEDEKLAELKKSDKIEDQLTALLMEPQLDNTLDVTGLFYAWAQPKACAILKRFHVTAKDECSTLSEK
jgi:hypothetical protein